LELTVTCGFAALPKSVSFELESASELLHMTSCLFMLIDRLDAAIFFILTQPSWDGYFWLFSPKSSIPSHTEVFAPQLLKERRKLNVFVPQLSKERRSIHS
jgi:hypothetical protein